MGIIFLKESMTDSKINSLNKNQIIPDPSFRKTSVFQAEQITKMPSPSQPLSFTVSVLEHGEIRCRNSWENMGSCGRNGPSVGMVHHFPGEIVNLRNGTGLFLVYLAMGLNCCMTHVHMFYRRSSLSSETIWEKTMYGCVWPNIGGTFKPKENDITLRYV